MSIESNWQKRCLGCNCKLPDKVGKNTYLDLGTRILRNNVWYCTNCAYKFDRRSSSLAMILMGEKCTECGKRVHSIGTMYYINKKFVCADCAKTIIETEKQKYQESTKKQAEVTKNITETVTQPKTNVNTPDEIQKEKSFCCRVEEVKKDITVPTKSKVLFRMWQQTILYCDGWYLYKDGKGNCSVISREAARAKELSYESYQASQDINRGGVPEEVAYANRGIKRIFNDKGHFVKFELTHPYCVDNVKGNPVEFKGKLVIPEIIGGDLINQVCDGAFYECGELTEVVLPESIKTIGRQAFYGCKKLKKLNIPKKIESIGEQAFEGTCLEKSDSKVLINGHLLVKADTSLEGEYVVPDEVTVIGENAFKGCTKLKKLVVHNGVTNIGTSAFSDCTNLKEIVLPAKINELGFGAFRGCLSLTEVIIPEGVKSLNHFYGCSSLTGVSIPESVEAIRQDCFKKTALVKAYEESGKEQLEVGNWLIDYRGNKSGELIIREGIVGIADQDMMKHSHYLTAAEYASITSIKLPNSLLYIGSDTFSYTGIKSIEIPSETLIIGMNAFRGSKLQSIVIPKSVISIEKWAFMDCRDLERIVFEGKANPEWPAITGRGNQNYMTIVARKNTPAHRYAMNYAAKHMLKFEELKSASDHGNKTTSKDDCNSEPVTVEDNKIILHGKAYYDWHSVNKKYYEKKGKIRLSEKTPKIALYEDDKLIHEYELMNTPEEDFTGKYFMYSVRMDTVGNPPAPVAQIDGFVAESSDEETMGQNIGYRFEGYNPIFGGQEAEKRRKMQADRDLIEKGLKYPGFITPTNVRLVGICSECGKSLTFIGYNYPAMNAVPLYSDDGLSVEASYDYDFDKENGVVEKDGKKFRYYNSFRCKHCGHPYIDYEHKREMKMYGNLGCVYVE